jgi:VCBS repeat-containing protein
VVMVGLSAGPAFARQALPVTVTGSTAWAVATSLPPSGPSTTFSYGTKPLVPVMGDWDGNGTRTPGTFEGGVFKLSNALPPAGPAVNVTFGDPRGFPVVGDFNGDGVDDLAVYRAGLWQIRMETGGIGSGGIVTPANVSAYAGSWPSTIPVAGDWDGNGTDGIGAFTALTGQWVLRQITAGPDLPAFTYNPGVSPYAVVGDWDQDGTDTVGVRAGTSWLLNNQNDSSAADVTFSFGLANDLPLVGGTGDVPPTAVNDTGTVAEDAGAAAVNVLGNDTDPDGGPKGIFSVTQPANGTVAVTGGGTGLTYQPNANYCNAPPGTSPDTFSYRLNTATGSTATVSMTVTCVDDPPVAVGDSATVAQDAAATAVPVLANDTDVDGGPKSIASNTQPANGTVAMTGGGTGLTYAPNAGYCNSQTGGSADTFTYSLTPGGSSATVSMSVTCAAANTPPDVDNSAGALAYTENDPPTAIDTNITVTDPDSANLTGATVQITGNYVSGQDVLALPAQPVITASFDAATGKLTLSGTTTVAAYEAALEAVTYANTSDAPSAATRTVTYQARDAGGFGTPDTHAIAITPVDDPPVAVNNAATFNEDDPAAAVLVLGNDTDVDGGPKVIASASDPANGTVVLTGGSPGAHTGLTYQPDPNYCNSPPGTSPDTFSYTLNGGSSATVSMTVTCVDDAPVAVNDSATVPVNASATAVSVLTNDTDIDGGPKAIASATDPANGTVVLTGGSPGAHTGLTYQPDPGYCNSPPGTSLDTFSYTLTPGGSSATVSMTVTCAADAPPTAVNDAATVAEDASATAVNVLANDTDPDGGPKSVASVTQPANGTVVITGGGTGLTYQPNANYCNSPPGTSPDTFTYTLTPGGSTATVSMTVSCVDDPPVAVNDAATVAEDASATAVSVLANDTDVDGGPKSIGSVTQPANGTVAITGGGTGLTYTPNANYCNSPPGTSPDTFTYTLNGGSSATVSMTVTCVNDNPVVDTSAGTVAYTENDPAKVIDTGVTVTDADAGASITGATVAITTNFASGQDVLALSGVHPGISALLIGNTLSLTGTAAPAAYQAALRDVTYVNTSDAPSALTRTVTFTVTDNGALTGSDTRAITIAAVDDPPVAVNNSATFNEDDPAAAVLVLGNDTDPDGGPKSIASVTQPANGTVIITGGGTGLTYQPNANYCNSPPGTSPDTFTYTLSPGGSTATVSITVACINDNPVVDTSAGSLAYTENDPAKPIDTAVTVTDVVAGAIIKGASVAITSNFAGVQDVLALSGVQPGISAGPQIGNTLTLTGTATPAAYQAALRAVTYANTSEGPSTLARTVTFTVTDNTALTGSDTRGITVTAVNDPPTAVNDSGTTDEDTTLTVAAPGVLANDTDVDPGDTKTVVALNGTATLTQTLPSGASVTINANGSYTYNPLSAFQGLSTGQSANDSFTYAMRDAANAQSTATVNLTINGVSDAPVAVADTFDAIGNTGLFVGTTRPAAQAGKEISGSVLTNDTDLDTPQASLVAEPVTNAPTTLGGTITIESDGNFTYHPDDVDTAVTDTFTYRVCDNSPCNSSTVANATGTLNLPIAGQVWYVKNNQAPGGDGTSDTPFDTLLAAENASQTGDTVYVFDGDNTPTKLNTGYLMEANERLIGESRPLSLDPDGAGALPTVSLFPGTSGAQPTLTASNEDVVVLASNVLVDGVDVDPAGTGGGISGAAGTSAVTVQNVSVTDTGTLGTQPGIEMDGTTGTNRFTGVSVTNGGSAGAIGVRLNNAGSVLFANTATNTIATSGAKALDAASTNLVSSRWNDITVTGSASGAIRLLNTTGLPALGDGAGTDLSLQTTSGATAALDIASSNGVSIDAAGTDAVSATGGPAVDIRNSNGSTFAFDSVSSTNSANDGINLDTNLASPFSATVGAISGAAGIAVDVNGGGAGGDVSYGGAINDGSGQSLEVTGRAGGAVTLTGNVADSADAGGGIVVSGNSAGSTTLSGTSKVLNTGASSAVATSSNGPVLTGHAVSFTGGGLDIDTTSGSGLTAQTGGSLTVTGTGNTIDTGTGNALFIDNTNIGASNVTFQRISANGASVGIRANVTGAVGRLIVTGNAGTCTPGSPATCTGGQLANLTGADNATTTPGGTGIMLNSTLNPSFTRMWIHDASNYAIRGTSVAGFTMADSVISGANGTTALTANKDGSARFEELTGTVNMTNVSLSGGYFTNLMVDNTAGVLNGTFDNVDSLALNATGGDDAVQFEGIGTSDMNIDFKNSEVTTASGDLLQYIGDGTGGGDLDLTGNTFTNNEPSIATGGGGIALIAGAKGAATMDVLNNTMRDSLTNALTIIKSRDVLAGTNNLVANITGNTIGAAPANSGSIEGDGMEITTFGDGNATFNVTSNTVRQYNSSGMQFVAGSGVVDAGQFNLNISGNTVANPGTNPSITLLQGIRVDSGVAAGDTFATCVKFGANSITGSSDAANKDFRLVASQSTTVRQPGYGGGNTDGTAFATFAAGLIGSGASGTAVANAPATFSGTGTTCP